MKQYYRPRIMGPKIIHGESTFYVVLDNALLTGFVETNVPVRAMRAPISQGGLTLVVNH